MKKTIYDIAKELNLAPSTVSKAISGKKDVSEKTRKRVLNYIEKVRYFPNANASKLKTKKTYTIGVIFSDDLNIGLEHSHFSSILQSFKTYVERRGYEITFVINNLGNTRMSYSEFCLQKGIEGVLVLTALPHDKGVYELIERGVPCVATDRYYKGGTTVISNNQLGVKIAVEHFLRKHYDKIGIVTGPIENESAFERLEAYKDTLTHYNIPINQDYIIYSGQYSFEYGYNCGEKYIQLKDKPKAFFVSSDELAFGFINRLLEAGYKIPEDIEIIGYDDIPFSKRFTPALTTIKQDTKMIGEIAGRKLINMIENEQHKIIQDIERVPVKLVIRDSTK